MATYPGTAPPYPVARGSRQANRWWLVLTCGCVAAAAFPSLRLELGGFSIPFHVVPLMFGATVGARRLPLFPRPIRTALMAFVFLFGIAVLRYGSQFGDLVKMVTSLVTILTIASLVRNRDDFLYAVLALAFAGIIINARGIQGGMVDSFGYQPLKGIGNKNAYSLYALPFVLLAGFSLLHFPQRKVPRAILIGCILSTAFVLFTGANRSGWGGIVLIGALLAVQARRWRALALVSALGLASYGALLLLGTTEIFEFRVQQTAGNYQSDETRTTLFFEALKIGLENPILGVGIQQLPFELAKTIPEAGDFIDPHNFIGYIVGGCGVFALLALGFVGLMMWRRPAGPMSDRQRLAHDLLRITVVLFVVRGFFSREIFFIAPFPIAIGLAIGLMLAEDDAPTSAGI